MNYKFLSLIDKVPEKGGSSSAVLSPMSPEKSRFKEIICLTIERTALQALLDGKTPTLLVPLSLTLGSKDVAIIETFDASVKDSFSKTKLSGYIKDAQAHAGSEPPPKSFPHPRPALGKNGKIIGGGIIGG